MNRPDTTAFLDGILHKTEFSRGGYTAKEVTIDAMTVKKRRVDYLRFVPPGAVHLSDIEKGIFICYEIKSCMQDVYSGNGLNFYGEKNYIVTTMETYKKLQPDIRSGKLDHHVKETNPDSSLYYGIKVAIPKGRGKYEEYEQPTKLEDAEEWTLHTLVECRPGPRKRSLAEMLFCMLRSGGQEE